MQEGPTRFRVTLLGPEDYVVLAMLRVAALRTDPGVFTEPLEVALDRRPEGWRRLLAAYREPGRGAIPAVWAGPEPIGLAGLLGEAPGPPLVGRICGVFVRPEWRGLGAAKLLMAALEAEARRLGFQRLRLDTVRTNEAANRLFMAAGFRGTGPTVRQPMGDGQTREVVGWAREL